MSELVIVEDHNDYGMLRLNRVEKRNAMNGEARAALRTALRALAGSHKVVVITGTSDSFCSGMDIKELANRPDAAAAVKEAAQDWIDTLLEIRRHPAVVIAAVNGFALGGGTSLINVADLAVAADEAEIGMPEMGFATYPGMAGPSTQLMLSPKRAAWMVLTAKRIDGITAERWGLVNLSVPRAALQHAADGLARHVAQFDAAALSESKRALDGLPHRDWGSAFDFGQQVNARIRADGMGKSQAQGLTRFAEGKKNPGQGRNG